MCIHPAILGWRGLLKASPKLIMVGFGDFFMEVKI